MADKPKRPPEDLAEEAPKRTGQDWDRLRGIEDVPAEPENDDVPTDRSGRVDTDEHYGEGQDNPYMESDSALPDDDEEAVFRRNNAREGGRFDEV
jgi:hypothetical protein